MVIFNWGCMKLFYVSTEIKAVSSVIAFVFHKKNGVSSYQLPHSLHDNFAKLKWLKQSSALLAVCHDSFHQQMASNTEDISVAWYRHRRLLCAMNGSRSATTNSNLEWSSLSCYSCFSNTLDLDSHTVEVVRHMRYHFVLQLEYKILNHMIFVSFSATCTAPFCHVDTSNEIQLFQTSDSCLAGGET